MNRSTVVSDPEVEKLVDALQKQLTDDFSPVWGVAATLRFISSKAKPGDPAAWQLIILDNTDQATDLGYHDVGEQGQPVGKVFAETDKKNNASWTVTASHELLEMLVDPEINLCAFVQDGEKVKLYAYETADPCEADQYGYEIDGVLVSDFVYPTWFEANSSPETRFDCMEYIKKPFELLPGGYCQYFDVSAGTGWQQKQMRSAKEEAHPLASRPHVGSRRERRRIDRSEWVASTAKK